MCPGLRGIRDWSSRRPGDSLNLHRIQDGFNISSSKGPGVGPIPPWGLVRGPWMSSCSCPLSLRCGPHPAWQLNSRRPGPTLRSPGRVPPPTPPQPEIKRLRESRGAQMPCKTWSGWGDSNSRPPAPKAGALTKLRYIPDRRPMLVSWQRTVAVPFRARSRRSSMREGRAIDAPRSRGRRRRRPPRAGRRAGNADGR